MVLNALIYISNELASALRCYVGISGDVKNPEISITKEIPVPQKVMDCKKWHDVQENAKKEEIKEEELKAKQMMDGDEKDCQLEKIEHMKNETFCKDDCLVCGSISFHQIGNKVSIFTCAGKKEMESMFHYHPNACRDLEPDDIKINWSCSWNSSILIVNTSITPISRFEVLNRQSPKDFLSGGKVCTCSSDGCEPPKDSGNPNPNVPNSNPSDTNENTGTTDKNNSDPATQPCILNLLFIIASFLSIRF